ncbi:MAG: hypothetical protein QXQ91_01505 [Nanopusillaceae archaeon]
MKVVWNPWEKILHVIGEPTEIVRKLEKPITMKKMGSGLYFYDDDEYYAMPVEILVYYEGDQLYVDVRSEKGRGCTLRVNEKGEVVVDSACKGYDRLVVEDSLDAIKIVLEKYFKMVSKFSSFILRKRRKEIAGPARDPLFFIQVLPLPHLGV